MGCSSIAFPILAAGNNGFDKEIAVQIAKESIEHFSGTNLKTVTLIAYDDNMKNIMESMGYTVMTIPDSICVDVRKAEHKAKREKLIADSKDIAQQFIEDQLQKAIDWLKDKRNREKVIQYGVVIAQIVLTKKPRKK